MFCKHAVHFLHTCFHVDYANRCCCFSGLKEIARNLSMPCHQLGFHEWLYIYIINFNPTLCLQPIWPPLLPHCTCFVDRFRLVFGACAPDWPLQNQTSKAYYTKPIIFPFNGIQKIQDRENPPKKLCSSWYWKLLGIWMILIVNKLMICINLGLA